MVYFQSRLTTHRPDYQEHEVEVLKKSPKEFGTPESESVGCGVLDLSRYLMR
jgi:hypothetical protein